MTTVTDEELLRLARKAWPDSEYPEGPLGGIEAAMCHPLARQALHAALLVLAGEVDLRALLDARSAPAEGAAK